MKFKLGIILLSSLVCASPALCDTINFTNPTGLRGASQTFGTVTAYGYTSTGTPTDLYVKNGGGTENGLGIANSLQQEITSANFVQLNLSSINSPFTLTIGSTGSYQAFEVCFSATQGVLGSSCTPYMNPVANPFTTGTLTKPSGDNYLSVTALSEVPSTNDNVLIDSMTTVAPTPEPSSLFLLGSGILGAAGVLRRRFVA